MAVRSKQHFYGGFGPGIGFVNGLIRRPDARGKERRKGGMEG